VTPSPDIPEHDIRERCRDLLSQAAEESRRLGHNYIGTEHIFIALTRQDKSAVTHLLKRASLSARKVRNEIRREIGTTDDAIGDVLPLTPRALMVLSLSIFLADQDKEEMVKDAHFLMALLQEGEGVPVRKLLELGFDLNLWLQRLIQEQQNDFGGIPIESDDIDIWNDDSDFDLDISDSSAFRPPNRSNQDRAPLTPLLDRYGRDLTAEAKDGKLHAAVARDKEIRILARTLSRIKKNNPLLLGDAGVGKTAIVEGLAYAIVQGTAPTPLLKYRLVQIEIGTLVAGTSLRGQFEERLLGILEEIKRAETIILFIDEIHTIVGAGDTIDSNLDAANILKPALARGEIMCIGATTHEEYRKAIAQDPALDRRFRTIDVEEPNEESTITILSGQRHRLENHHEVEILDETIEAAVMLSVRYLADRRLPDKALDLLDEACTRVTIQSTHPDIDPDELAQVIPADIAEVLSEWTGIPITELTQDEKQRLAQLEDVLRERIMGQDQAIELVSSAIRTARTGLNDPNRPIGVFLFLGTSGVGKTELARALAHHIFGSEDAILRLDMSEFHDAHTVSRLIGSPPGYKESSRGGQLTDGLRRRPHSIVLLDEIEKATPEVYDIFLQIFDEGRLSDAHGRSVDARHSIFIMTSNVGTKENANPVGFGSSNGDTDDLNFAPHLKDYFRPEFLNRIDEIVTFNQLNRETLSDILDLQLQDLLERLHAQHYELELTDMARDLILHEGHDPSKGARPLRRAIERMLTRPLSHHIVEDTFPSHSTIVVTVEDGEFVFHAASQRST